MKYTSLICLFVLVNTSLALVAIKQDVNCRGEYQEATNNLAFECLDDKGVIVSRQEEYFSFSLVKVCNPAVAFSNISASLKGYIIPSSLSDQSMVICCDFYQRTVGYAFSHCDSGLNAVIMADRMLGPVHEQYKNMVSQFEQMDWNWNELLSLVQNYCANSSISAAANVPSVQPKNRLEDVFMKLEIPWADYLSLANQNPNRTIWTKDIYKQWLQFYSRVLNAYNLYISQQNATIVNATNTATATDASGSASSSSSSASSTTAGGVVNSSAVAALPQASIVIWQPEFDDAAMTLDLILANLTSSGYLAQFNAFFDQFFGINGLVAKMNKKEVNIPMGLEEIVHWIAVNVDAEVHQRCTACKAGVALPVPAKKNISAPAQYSADKYILPQGCQLNQTVNAGNASVCCIDNNSSGCYSFDHINAFVDPDILNITCSQIMEVTRQCKDSAVCVQQAVQSLMVTNSISDIYAWLHFDRDNAAYIHEQCADFVKGFMSKNEFILAFAGYFHF